MKKRVFADYEAKTKYELTIKAGQIVDKLSEISDNGWCIVQFADSSGWVPAGYLEETEATVFLSMLISFYTSFNHNFNQRDMQLYCMDLTH